MEFHVFIRLWMTDTQYSRMKGLPLESGKRTPGRAIYLVSQDRMTDTGHVYADLVGPS